MAEAGMPVASAGGVPVMGKDSSGNAQFLNVNPSGVGTVAIDQTTPGTTNAVAPIAGQNGVQGGAGTTTAITQRVTVATDDALHTKIGEVQATPTSNTILGRLKDLLTGIVLSAGSAIIGKVGIDQTTPGTTNAVVANASAVSGGIPSTARLLSATGTGQDANLVKGSAGRVYHIQGANVASATRYLKLYDTGVTPVVGTDTPRKTLHLPASQDFVFDFPIGLSFANGIGFGLTTIVTDNSTVSVTAGDILALNIDYA